MSEVFGTQIAEAQQELFVEENFAVIKTVSKHPLSSSFVLFCFPITHLGLSMYFALLSTDLLSYVHHFWCFVAHTPSYSKNPFLLLATTDPFAFSIPVLSHLAPVHITEGDLIACSYRTLKFTKNNIYWQSTQQSKAKLPLCGLYHNPSEFSNHARYL